MSRKLLQDVFEKHEVISEFSIRVLIRNDFLFNAEKINLISKSQLVKNHFVEFKNFKYIKEKRMRLISFIILL